MICEPYEVVAVPFPFMERPAVKRRPAVVLSTGEFNAENEHSVMAMITAAMMDSWPSDYHLLKPHDAGLQHDCYVRWKVFTLPNIMIVKKIGILSQADQDEIKAKARTVFART